LGLLRPGDAVLDVGCGAGIDLLVAAQLVGPTGRVCGVDLTPEMVERARANLGQRGEVSLGSAEPSPSRMRRLTS
jgi:ubiquinone/menaquinone biosynthesis C-methylase UbiE